MRLPSDQYVCIPLPARATLTRQDVDEFLLRVPKVKFFHVECLPTVYCSVSTEDNQVTIRSNKCILSGSDAVERLNSCYKFEVTTRFRWVDTKYDKRIISTSDILVFVNPPQPFKSIPSRVLEQTGNYVMKKALDFIELNFIQSLATDYGRWAVDPLYREERARKSSQSGSSPPSGADLVSFL
jgi:hypothetical protein